MILSNKRIPKALISLRRCACWSAPLIFANPEDKFSRVGAHIVSQTGRMIPHAKKMLKQATTHQQTSRKPLTLSLPAGKSSAAALRLCNTKVDCHAIGFNAPRKQGQPELVRTDNSGFNIHVQLQTSCEWQ